MKARFAWNPHAAEFKPGQNEDGSPRISGLIENETEKEIDLLNLLKRLLHSGIEEENESDEDVSMGLTPTSAVHGPQSVQLNDEPTEHHTRATATHGCGRTSSALVVLHFCIFFGGVPWSESDRAQSHREAKSEKVSNGTKQIWKAGVKDPPAKRNVGGVSLLYISSPSFWATTSCWTCKDVRRAKLQTAGSGHWEVGHGLFATPRQRVADRLVYAA